MHIKTSLAVGLFAVAVLPFAPTSASAQNMNPELLASNCVVCHGPNGESVSHIPAINALNANEISDRMREFRDGKRAATIMDKIAKGYNDAQIDLIAEHFGAK
jgi:cytochrome c553